MTDGSSTSHGIKSRVRGLLAITLVFSIFTNLLMLTGPLFMLQVYDRVLASRSEETLVALFGLVALLYFFYWLIEYARARVVSRVGARLHERLGGPVFLRIFERSARRLPQKEGSLQDLEAVRNLFASPVILALFDLPWTPVFIAAIFIFHPMLGWVALVGGLALVVAAIVNQILTAKKSVKASELSRAAGTFARQAEASSEYVVTQGMRANVISRWVSLQDDAMRQSLHASDWTGSFSAFTKAFRLFLQSAILAVGAWYVLQGQLTAGAMIAASILLGRALAPVDIGVANWSTVQNTRQSWSAIRQLLQQEISRDPETVLPAPKPHLTATNVTLYLNRGESPVLRQVSFEVKPGEALGVIGRSGSGKSTLARVVTGLYAPSIGEVRLDGALLHRLGSERIGRHVGYLPQEVQFFNGTVAENIARMDVEPDHEMAVDAAEMARVHDIILSLPDGYDTPIGEAAFALSGGQKQRLGLARAFYGDPVLLVLDEPNAALDAEGSEALNHAVQEMKNNGGSVIIMTHRPTALSACDKLLLLDGGRAVAFGDRDEVIKKMMVNAGQVARVVQGGKP